MPDLIQYPDRGTFWKDTGFRLSPEWRGQFFYLWLHCKKPETWFRSKPRDLPAGRRVQGAKFSGNEPYLAYVAWAGKLKQRRRLGFFSGIIS